MYYLYIGGYGEEGISICKFCDGKIEKISASIPMLNPAYLHINNDVIYAVLENETHNNEHGRKCYKF